LIHPFTFYQRPEPNVMNLPSKNQRRQNHSAFLVFDLEQKSVDLEIKRMAASKSKREAKQKYGW
jgi:hypothetical protein